MNDIERQRLIRQLRDLRDRLAEEPPRTGKTDLDLLMEYAAERERAVLILDSALITLST